MEFIGENKMWLRDHIKLSDRAINWAIRIFGCIGMLLIYLAANRYINDSVARAILGAITLVISADCVPMMSGSMERFIPGASVNMQTALMYAACCGCVIEVVLLFARPMDTAGAVIGIAFAFFSAICLILNDFIENYKPL